MRLCDVTLREGDQLSDRSYSFEQKTAAARRLDDLGLSYVQPGFPATGEKDQRVVADLAESLTADIVALARALDADVDAALQANADVVEVFGAASDRHLDHLLGTTREEMVSSLTEAVARVRDHGAVPHVTLTDAFRTETRRLVHLLEAVPEAPVVTLADTVGCTTPSSVTEQLDALAMEVDLSRVGVHFHDDLGCATANVLAAQECGVAKADVSVGGIGERAGNSELETVVAACMTDRGEDLDLATDTLVPVCRDVLDKLGEEYDPRTPVIGPDVHEHEAGLHTAAMLADPATMEAFDPAVFGAVRRLRFGQGTGAAAARELLGRAGVHQSDENVEVFLESLATEGPVGLDRALELARDLNGNRH